MVGIQYRGCLRGRAHHIKPVLGAIGCPGGILGSTGSIFHWSSLFYLQQFSEPATLARAQRFVCRRSNIVVLPPDAEEEGVRRGRLNDEGAIEVGRDG